MKSSLFISLIALSCFTLAYKQDRNKEGQLMDPQFDPGTTILDRETFFTETEGKDWLILFCHSRHWECPKYMREYWDPQIALPLSLQINVGYIDSYYWVDLRSKFEAWRNPSLYLIKNGTFYYRFHGDVRSKKQLLEFINGKYKKEKKHNVPVYETWGMYIHDMLDVTARGSMGDFNKF